MSLNLPPSLPILILRWNTFPHFTITFSVPELEAHSTYRSVYIFEHIEARNKLPVFDMK